MAYYEFSNVIHPKKMLPYLKAYLVPRYLEDYGEENKDIILKKWDDAIFLFDSNPVDTRDFMLEFLDEIKDPRFAIRTEIEYQNYMRVREMIHKQTRKAFEISLIENQYVLPQAYVSNLWDLDFESYSYDVYEECKDNQKLNERRVEYEIDCMEKGIRPVKDFHVIEKILYAKKVLMQLEEEELLRRSFWGKRLKKEIKKDYAFAITDELLREIIFDRKNCGVTGICIDSNEKKRSFVYFPIIQNKDFPSLDHIFFHEARHLVENGENAGGLFSYLDGYYYYINELHTEKNALLDEKRKECIYFGGGDSHKISLYQYLFKDFGEFFDLNRERLNTYAFAADIKGFENEFGEDFLKEMERKLAIAGDKKYYDEQKKKTLER